MRMLVEPTGSERAARLLTRQELARSNDPTVSEYAMGCLHNATEIIAATVASRQVRTG